MPRKQGLIYKYKNPCSKTNMKQTHFIHQNKSYKATVKTERHCPLNLLPQLATVPDRYLLQP